jgi:hypothetical protein
MLREHPDHDPTVLARLPLVLLDAKRLLAAAADDVHL